MKIIISSLQVSRGSSKGHLHPAIEIALALKRRGHHVALLPLPCPYSDDDILQINQCGLEMIQPPALPDGLPLTPDKLGQLAKSADTTHLAYESFLFTPLARQFDSVMHLIAAFQPDIVVYDLLVYAAPLAARKLGIRDIGFCAGLKLIAPDTLTDIYQSTAQKIAPKINEFLRQQDLSANFHHLELLSETRQMVFTNADFIGESEHEYPAGTALVGPLPVSTTRAPEPDNSLLEKSRGAVILCLGCVLDPGNYPHIIDTIVNVTRQFKRHLVIASSKLKDLQSDNITVLPYLPLPGLLANAGIIIHHGGANTFSEALASGARQILIPLTTDQPIQGEYLRRSKSGITLHPDEINEASLQTAYRRLFDPEDEIHRHINKIQQVYQQGHGAENAAILIEETMQKR